MDGTGGLMALNDSIGYLFGQRKFYHMRAVMADYAEAARDYESLNTEILDVYPHFYEIVHICIHAMLMLCEHMHAAVGIVMSA
jgi:hypothetical protein